MQPPFNPMGGNGLQGMPGQIGIGGNAPNMGSMQMPQNMNNGMPMADPNASSQQMQMEAARVAAGLNGQSNGVPSSSAQSRTDASGSNADSQRTGVGADLVAATNAAAAAASQSQKNPASDSNGLTGSQIGTEVKKEPSTSQPNKSGTGAQSATKRSDSNNSLGGLSFDLGENGSRGSDNNLNDLLGN